MSCDHPFIGLVIGIVSGALVGAGIGAAIIKQTAVEKGHAFYHPQTGHFTWKENQGTATKAINLGVYDDKTNTFTLPGLYNDLRQPQKIQRPAESPRKRLRHPVAHRRT